MRIKRSPVPKSDSMRKGVIVKLQEEFHKCQRKVRMARFIVFSFYWHWCHMAGFSICIFCGLHSFEVLTGFFGSQQF